MTEAVTAAPSEATAFEDFFEAERGRLFGAVYLMTGDVDEAEEIVQDAFLAVLERWERVGSMERPDGYLYRTAMNGFRSRRRRLLRATARRLPFGSSEDPYAAVDLHDAVVRALRDLAPRQRAAVVLTDLLDIDSTEAGRLLAVKPATVRNLAAQARAALKRAMENDRE